MIFFRFDKPLRLGNRKKTNILPFMPLKISANEYLSGLLAVIILFLTVLYPVPGWAIQETAPASIGIPGGPIFAIAVSGDSKDAVYVGTGVGIFKSVYAEDIWSPVNEGLDSTYVYDIVLDPITPTIIFAATEEGVFNSTDGGEKWVSKGLKDSKIFSFAVHPVSVTYLAAGTIEGVFTSSDGGSQWSEKAAGPSDVYAVVFDPDNQTIIYAGSFGGGIYKSTDFGTTWSRTGSGPEFVHHIAINPTGTNVLYAGTNSGMYKSTNSGTSWSKINSDFSNLPVYSIAVTPSSPSTVYAATDMGAYKTTDAGSTWSRTNNGIVTDGLQGPFVREIAVDPANQSKLYAGTYSGDINDVDIYRSTNSASSWSQINRELANTTVHSLAFDTEDPNVVYAGTGTVGVLKSNNRGLSWEESNSGLTKYFVKSIAVNPDSADVYAGTRSGLFSSSNGGEEWTEASPNYEIYTIGTDPHTPENIYIGTNWGIFFSIDDGETWSSLNNNLINPSILTLAFHPDESGTLYVGTNGDGIFKSTSSGESWLPKNAGLAFLQVLSLAVDTADTNTIYAGTKGGGVYKSIDGGETWQPASFSLEGLTANTIVVNPEDSDIVYAGMETKGFYKSADGGQSWEVGSRDISDKTVYDLALDPEDAQTLFVATEGDILIFTFNMPPNLPSSPSPVDGAVSQPLAVLLSWTGEDPDAGDSLTFKVYFGTDESPQTNAAGEVSTAEYDPGTLQLNRTYYWQVIAVDGHNAETAGDVWSFATTISNPPLVPSNPSPKDGSENQPLPITLSWSGGDTDNDDIVTYDIYLGVQETPPLAKENVEETTFQPLKTMVPFTDYYWKVVSRDNNGLETEGPVWHFKSGLPKICYIEVLLGDNEPALHVVRRFRDEWLIKTESGRALIKLYYLIAPALAALAEDEPELKAVTLKFWEEFIPVLEKALENGKVEISSLLLQQAQGLLNLYAAKAGRKQ